jgi:hypothetical protein
VEQFQQAPVHWAATRAAPSAARRSKSMNGIIYLVGLIVVVLAILSFLGLR